MVVNNNFQSRLSNIHQPGWRWNVTSEEDLNSGDFEGELLVPERIEILLDDTSLLLGFPDFEDHVRVTAE